MNQEAPTNPDTHETRAIIDDKLAVFHSDVSATIKVALAHLPTTTQMLAGMGAIVAIVISIIIGAFALIDTGAGVASIFTRGVEQNRQDIAENRADISDIKTGVSEIQNKQDELLEAIESVK